MLIQELIKDFHKSIPSHQPFTYVDVGAMGGLDKEWSSFKDYIHIIGFEPDDREFKKLPNSSNQNYFNVALFETDNTPLTLYISKDPGKTSIFKPNREFLRAYPSPERFETVNTATIEADKVKSLDTVIQTQANLDVDFLKIDTQGSELSILKGSKNTLQSIVGIKIEVEFVELYKNQPLFADVDQFLRSHGFDLVDLRRSFWKKSIYKNYSGKGQLIFGDALYIKNSENLKTEKILKYAMVGLAHGMHDLAIQALQHGINRDSQNQQTYKDLISKIKDYDSSSLIGKIFKSRRVSLVSEIVKKKFGKSLQDFADSDAMLGNRRTY